MSSKQWKRLDVLRRLEQGKLRAAEAAEILGIGVRQVRRLRRKYEAQAEGCVIHGNAGQAPSNRTSGETQAMIVKLATGKYLGFNDSHLTEKLGSLEGLTVSRSTVRRLLRAGGIAPARPRRSKIFRRRREREAQAGMMLLWDGSRHDWLEGRGPILCLMAAIDDATGELMPGAHFVLQECAAGYLRVLEATVNEKGIPQKLYMDMHGSLKRNDDFWSLEEEMAGKQQPTQVGQALEELGVEAIYALSPQAKGRVERMWGTLQDRLSSELRLKTVSTLEEANEFLKTYRHDFNKRFAILARSPESAFRRVPQGLDVSEACAFRYEATVGNDNVVTLGKVHLQIPRPAGGRSYAKAKVEARQLLSGTWRVNYQGQRIAELTLPGEAAEVKPRQRRKRSQASRAFREAVKKFAPRRARIAKTAPKTKRPRKGLPYNYWPKKAKLAAARASAQRRKLRPGPY